jgi:hypothetical protein
MTRELCEKVATLLLAGDVQARVVANEKANFVEVRLFDGGIVLWSPDENPWWSFSIVDPDGEMHTGMMTGLSITEDPEIVARTIATYAYPAPVEFPVDEEG